MLGVASGKVMSCPRRDNSPKIYFIFGTSEIQLFDTCFISSKYLHYYFILLPCILDFMLTTSLPYKANWFYALLLQEANWLHPKSSRVHAIWCLWEDLQLDLKIQLELFVTLFQWPWTYTCHQRHTAYMWPPAARDPRVFYSGLIF